MKTVFLLLTISLACLSFGCAGYDRISHKNAQEALDTIENDLDPALPQEVKDALTEQAEGWVRYEESKK